MLDFSAAHGLPEDLAATMAGHMRLSYRQSSAADEAVLLGMPTSVRRRVMRHLYLGTLKRCARRR